MTLINVVSRNYISENDYRRPTSLPEGKVKKLIGKVPILLLLTHVSTMS